MLLLCIQNRKEFYFPRSAHRCSEGVIQWNTGHDKKGRHLGYNGRGDTVSFV